MTLEEVGRNLNELELKFEGLKETMIIFQENINNNISWFLAVVGIIIALIGAVAVALYFLVKSAVKAGVENGINDVTSTVQTEILKINDELKEFEGNLDHRVIQLIKNNSNIRWAKGNISLINKDYTFVGGLNGTVDWDSPITNVRVYNPRSKQDIPIELIERRGDSFSFKINTIETLNSIEWIIVWSEKDDNSQQ